MRIQSVRYRNLGRMWLNRIPKSPREATGHCSVLATCLSLIVWFSGFLITIRVKGRNDV